MTTDPWWDTVAHDAAISTLIDGWGDIAHLPIPYGQLPTRASTYYGDAFAHWSDLADETITSLIKRPKAGMGTVRSIIDAARTAHAKTRSATNTEPATAAATLVANLPENDRIILACRRWARPPMSQQETAERLKTHGAWVHRHEARAAARFAELLAEPEYSIVAGQAELLRRLLGPVTAEQHIADDIAILGVKTDDATTDMLVYLAGPYTSQGAWLVHEPGDGMAAAVAAIQRTLTRFPAPTMTEFQQSLAAIGVQPDVATELVANQPELRRFGDHWVRWGTAKADKAEAVLHLSVDRTPATIEMIAAAIGDEPDNPRALRQCLHEDPRFARATQFTWALRSWGLPEYSGVFNEIAKRIDAAGGAISVADVVDDISTAFPDVSEVSITTYVNTLAFTVEHGMVRHRTPSDPWPTIPPLNRARGAYRLGQNQVRVAFTVNTELLRGSGQPVPRPVAKALSVGPGQERLFTGSIDAVVRWRMSSTTGPSMNSLRPLAVSLGAKRGDTIVLAFNLKTSALEAACLRSGESLNRWLETLLGQPANDPIAALARSLDCTPGEIVSVLQRRGDNELAALLGADNG